MPLAPEKLNRMLVGAVLKNDAGGIAGLVAMGADTKLSDPKGNTPLLIAATDPREHGALKALLEAKADPNFPGANGALPLHAVLRMKDDRLMPQAVALLIGAGADPNAVEKAPNKPQLTPLQIALGLNRNDKVLDALLRGGADPARGENAAQGLKAPLHMLALEGRYAALEAAALCGADLNRADAEGRTCLMIAARAGAQRTVEMLVERGADPHLRDKHGLDAAAHARAAPPDTDFRPLLKILLQASNDHSLRREVEALRVELENLRRTVTEKLGGKG
jgi:ankyrin repeat protein